MSLKTTGFVFYSTRFLLICLMFSSFAQAAAAQNSTQFDAEISVTKTGGQVDIKWRTNYEINTLGFHVWREINNEKARVTPEIIAGSLLQNGENAALTAGNDYTWTDKLTDKINNLSVTKLHYWIEEINADNKSVWHDAAFPKIEYESYESARISLLKSAIKSSNEQSSNDFETHFPAFELSKTSQTDFTNTALSPSEQQKVLANDAKAIKFSISHDGWFRVERSQLAYLGVDSLAKKDFLSLYFDGEEQSLMVNTDGSIEFYGRGTDNRFTKSRVYWLAVGTERGKRISLNASFIENNNEITVTDPATSFLDVTMRRDRKILVNSILNGETENYFGAFINSAGLTQTLSAISPVTNGENANLTIALQGLTGGQHEIHVQFNGIELGAISFNDKEYVTKQFPVAASILTDGSNTMTFGDKFPGTNLIDYARLTYARDLKAVNDKLNFAIAANQAAIVTNFSSPKIRFYDITNASNVSQINAVPQNIGEQNYTFTIAASSAPRKIIALRSNAADKKIKFATNNASHLNDADNNADFVIIAHHDFLNAVEPLKVLRESQGLKTQVIDVKDIYDEFSYGLQTPHAIHDFLLYANQNWTRKPRYVLFVGDSTNDPRNYLGKNATDFVPTYFADGYYGEAASDTEMANFSDEEGFEALEEIAFGRLSVKTQTEAQNAVKKITDYENRPSGDTLQRGIVLLNDRLEGYDFEDFTNQIRDFLPTNMPQQIINRSGGTPADIRARLLTAINDGAGIVNFMGHGTSSGWTSANLLTVNDAATLTNNPRQSLFVALACLNGSFTEYQDTFAETMVKTPNGGAVGMLASSGLTLPYGQVIAIEKLYEVILSGDNVRLGDAIRQAKAANTDLDVRRLMVFFGDPTMKIK